MMTVWGSPWLRAACRAVQGRAAGEGGGYLWVAKDADKLLHSQIMGQLLKGLRLVLGEGVVHVKAHSLQHVLVTGSSGLANAG